jgi:hypothetical protein
MFSTSRPRCRKTVRAHFIALLGVFLFSAQCARAGLFTLADENSSILFNTASPTNASNWQVDGVDQLNQQAFWYRVGNTAEQSVHSLPIAFEMASNTNFDPNLDTLFTRYLGAGFHIDMHYSLDGGLPGSRTSDLAEQISISNTGSSPLDFHFFQYNDFDLNGTAAGDSAVFTNANAVRQTEGTMGVSETVVTPVPSHREIDTFAATLSKLVDAVPTTLSDLPAVGNVAGPGDMTWAFQWDFVLAPGRTYLISKDKHLSGIPEPTAAVLMTLGVGLVLAVRRTR